MDDVGRYRCHVENIHGSEDRLIDLNVYLPPTIKTTAEEDLTISVGQAVTIPCEATGNPKPTVAWYVNGAQIRSQAEFKKKIFQ